ncbi:uncharacterized protein LOC144661629 [Oculina patagonica]
MDNMDEALNPIYIGMVVAIFLLNTCRGAKAIELLKECLIFLNNSGLKKEPAKFVSFCFLSMMFWAYSDIADHKNAIQYGKKVLEMCRECGFRDEEGGVAIELAGIYQSQIKHTQAKELYERAINIMEECGNRKNIASAYRKFGILHVDLGEFTTAKKYLEKAIAVRIEIGDRKGEAEDYGILGNVFHCLREFNKAKEYHEKALAIDLNTFYRKGEAEDYRNLGSVFHSLGEFDKAMEYHEKALKIDVTIFNRKGEAEDYSRLGALFNSLGEFHKAKECLDKAVKIRKVIGDKEGEAADYRDLGGMFLSLGEFVKAKECLEKALTIRKAISFSTKGEAADHRKLGNVFRSLGKYDQAKDCFEKALMIHKAWSDGIEEAIDLGHLGSVLYSLGQYDKAKECYEKALTTRKGIGERNKAFIYEGLGTVLQSLGDYGGAKEYLEKALMLRKGIDDRKEAANDYGKLGSVFHSLGDYTKARKYHKKALAIDKEEGNREGEANDYVNLGNVFHSLGEYGKAKEYYEKALPIYKAVGDRKGEAINYWILGNEFHCLGELDKAKEYQEKALMIRKEIGDRRGEASSYENLGTLFRSIGQYDKAKKYLEKALAIRINIGDRKEKALCHGKLATAFHTLGEYEKTKENHEKAVTTIMETGNREWEASFFGELGVEYFSVGEYYQAKECLEKALKIEKEIGDGQEKAADLIHMGTVFVALREFDRAEEFLCKALSKGVKSCEHEYDCYFGLAAVKFGQNKLQESFDYSFQCIKKFERFRDFRVGNDQLKISSFDKHIYPYQILIFFGCVVVENAKFALYFAELGRARALADLMAAQYSAEKHSSANMPLWAGTENIMKKESNCTCLWISYCFNFLFLWILDSKGIINFRKIKVNKDFVFAGSIDNLNNFFAKSVRSSPILSEDECEDRSLNGIWHNLKQSQDENPVALRLVEDDDDESQDPEPSLPLLYKMIIAPVVDLLDEPEIIIVPDRSLYHVPFAALSDENGKYITETFRIRIVPSLTTMKLIHNSPAGYHSQTGALIVGDPKVGRVFYKGCLENFKPLPCAREEAEMIGRLLGLQPLLGEQATKQAVLQRIHSVSLIHFAAHGNAERGEIALSPLHATHQTPQEEDYLLTMSDISQVQLRAKLVVLSCCHSARGQIKAEGVVGIARAFLGSGARSVLVALWALGDGATEQFMNRFYKHLSNGESASESLHEAMKWMRGNGYSKVCDWAPFMLIGDNVTLDFGKLKKKDTTNGGFGYGQT